MQSLFIISVSIALFAVGAAVFLWHALTKPYQGYSGERVRVEVKRGLNSRGILSHLQQAGVLRDDFFPLLYLKTVRRGDSLKAGVYEFNGAVSAIDVLDKLASGDVVLGTVTIREGLDRFAVAALMADAGFGTIEEWEKVTGDGDLVRDLDPDAESLEGFLFPDTYKLAPGSRPDAIAASMVQNFRSQFGDELALIANGLDVHQTVTLASIIETEAQRAEERPLIASVYLNRVKLNMPLQADPTVIYALKLQKRWDGNIRKADLQMASPYNTYRQRGFPPGPIANPGIQSLRAAAAPARTSFLYFVSRNDGSHVFSNSLAEHNRNVEEHQRRFFRRQRAQQQ